MASTIGEYLVIITGKITKEAIFKKSTAFFGADHPKKMKMRGYNQSECNSKGLSNAMVNPIVPNLVRPPSRIQEPKRPDSTAGPTWNMSLPQIIPNKSPESIF
jgi:hypothetical protein